MLAAANPWAWQPHPEVWVLVATVVALGLYVTRVIAPKVHPDGGGVTRRNKGFFLAGVAVLWIASDWPLHDIAEEWLYSVHMIQHLLLTFVMPPLIWFSVPTWLAELILGDGRVRLWFERLTKPVVAGVVFNAVVAISHWSALVNASVNSGPFHYLIHLIVVFTAFMMWVPICGPLPERRMALPAQMIYLFLMSIIPTVPGAWLTFAENAVYKSYDVPNRLWGVGVIDDQQMAGLIMKVGGGTYLWSIITYLFVTWASRHAEADRKGIKVTERDLLTWDDVQAEFDRLGPARSEEPVPGKPTD